MGPQTKIETRLLQFLLKFTTYILLLFWILVVLLHESLPVFREIQFKRFLEPMDMDGDVQVVES